MSERIRARLDVLERSQLVSLVQRMVDARPELADLILLPLPGEVLPLDTGPLTARTTTILRTMGDDWRASWRAQFEFVPLLEVADERLQAGATEDARRAYRAIADAILALYVRIRDEESEIAGVVCDCVTGLGRALDATVEPALRLAILRDVFDIYAWDRIANGSYGVSDPARPILAERATAQERRTLLDWILAARPGGETREARRGRRSAGELALALLDEKADPGAVESVLQWSGLTGRYVPWLLAAGRHEDALRALATGTDDTLKCADLLVAAGLRDETLRVMTRHPEVLDERWASIPAWLERHGHDATALAALVSQVDRFRHHPTIGEWDRARALAEGLGMWGEVAPRLLAVVDDERVSVRTVRARALVAVGRLDEAVAVLATVNPPAVASCAASIARDATSRRPDIARDLLGAAIARLEGRNTRVAREERERLLRELAALPEVGPCTR